MSRDFKNHLFAFSLTTLISCLTPHPIFVHFLSEISLGEKKGKVSSFLSTVATSVTCHVPTIFSTQPLYNKKRKKEKKAERKLIQKIQKKNDSFNYPTGMTITVHYIWGKEMMRRWEIKVKVMGPSDRLEPIWIRFNNKCSKCD